MSVDTEAVTDGADSGDEGPPEHSRTRRWATIYCGRLSFTGAIVATAFLWFSTTPSLLPRGPLFQGVVSAGAAALGYLLGALLAWLARYLVSRAEPWPRPPRTAWIVLGVVAAAGTAVMLYWFARWQDQLRDLMGVGRLSWVAYPQILVIAVVVFAALLLLGQAWGALVRVLTRRLSRHVPPRISSAVAVVIVVVVSLVFVNDVVAKNTMQALNSTFAAVNDESTPDSAPPASPLRSGGPGSLASWESLGRMGRAFVSTGPSAAEIAEFNGEPSEEPIRVYAGIDSAPDIDAAADLAARELVRAGGLDRAVIGIASTTGTGWINRANPDSLEYMFNGDTAMVSMQYSTLPSWLSFLVDQERARQAGRALFEAVDKVVREVPEAQRPKVVVFGESLGSFAGESPFGSIPTMAARTDGVLLTGPTFSNTLWRDTTDDRDPGSPEYLPVVADGEQVRFISDATDLDRPTDEPWSTPRIVYLQHASDPIAWWSPDLILSEPDWLDERRGPDVLGATRWIPFVTFLQVSADMAVSVDVPDGHGHHYLAAIPKAWARILEPAGWTDADTERLLPHLTRD
ncbi:alpha/beta hydrolase [Gordonia sp. (in: high G+C Gram-positive bacteria)]|uniref:alpha/beta hydrolase n=1 Tax=Gordonia sp. (in: high G+C Gram-positive bacteria) TaxID=84139 RepID=UPI003F9A1BC1